MTDRHRLKNLGINLQRLVRYNLKIIFANKFIFFLIAAILFFLLVTTISLFSDSSPNEGTVYGLLMFPGLLIIFYPAAFGIQNDVDANMIETLFGIPNYRYKVWLVRIALIYAVVFIILVGLSGLSAFAIMPVPILEMTFQLMFPIFFLGSLAFMLSTLIRNGNGAAVVMVIIGVAFWIASDIIDHSKWNIFLNPFDMPSDLNEAIWADITMNNRIYLTVGSVLSILWGLLNLQKREKFV